MMLLMFLVAFIGATCSGMTLEKICVIPGEMVALHCPSEKAPGIWSTPSGPPSVDRAGLLISDGSLVLLSASETQQGNYSCEQGALKETFELRFCERSYSDHCTNENSCSLRCPDAYTPKPGSNVTSTGVTWLQDGTVMKGVYYFSNVKESDQGNYSCVRSFLYRGHVYNMTFAVKLVVKPKEIVKNTVIRTPHPNAVFYVDVGSAFVINCTAVLFSDLDDLYWTFNKSFVRSSNSSRIHSSSSSERLNGDKVVTASLVFREVRAEDLSTVSTCYLKSIFQDSMAVNVTLAQKAGPSYVAVTVLAVVIPVVLVGIIIISIKYKIHMIVFLRDVLGHHHKPTDGKSFDVCVMYYTSVHGAALSDDDRQTLHKTLEDDFGYSLCLFDRDVPPGKAVANAVLDCVEQSRAVLMVPAGPDLSSESAVLSAVHEALVEHQTRLIVIKCKRTEKTRGSPVSSETLEQLTDLGHCVTWRTSNDPTSFFWKQLRYYLPPVKQDHKLSMLPERV